MRVCYFCGHAFDDNVEIFRSTVCPGCDNDVKICKNCTFYSPESHWECRETIPEPVREKEQANFCSFFQFKESSGNEKQGKNTEREEAKDAFNKLFGD